MPHAVPRLKWDFQELYALHRTDQKVLSVCGRPYTHPEYRLKRFRVEAGEISDFWMALHIARTKLSPSGRMPPVHAVRTTSGKNPPASLPYVVYVVTVAPLQAPYIVVTCCNMSLFCSALLHSVVSCSTQKSVCCAPKLADAQGYVYIASHDLQY